ncbi:hypothetical protein KAU11_02675 [Candidatus Babeliales bacterium]|nr:hypothetical protein [Candidatus Babeliales bacterium]
MKTKLLVIVSLLTVVSFAEKEVLKKETSEDVQNLISRMETGEFNLPDNPQDFLKQMIPFMRDMKKLDLSSKQLLTELPETIDQLGKLTSLHLNYTGIRFLPKSVTSLKNIEVLELKQIYDANRFIVVPFDICKMYKLLVLKTPRGVVFEGETLKTLKEYCKKAHNIFSAKEAGKSFSEKDKGDVIAYFAQVELLSGLSFTVNPSFCFSDDPKVKNPPFYC